MTPVYASNRAEIGGWYAFDLVDDGRRVFWDGGIGQRQQGATGFWCPYSGNIVDAPDKMIDAMPDVALDGCIHDGEFLVTGFPKINHFSTVIQPDDDIVRYIYRDPTKLANFADEILYGPELIEDSPVCRMVRVEQLPDDHVAALDTFRDKYPHGIARHPQSVWSPHRSRYIMANLRPDGFSSGRVREIHHSETMDYIDFVTVWATIEKELKVVPLYGDDHNPDCPFWKVKQRITLFTVEDLVIGYE